MPENRKCVIVDIDGTLADVEHRLHHIRGRRKNWKKFFALMSKDDPIKEVIDQVKELAKDHDIYLVSGRPDDYLEVTLAWLELHQVPFKDLYMRESGDYRPDFVVKQEILDAHFDKAAVALVIEDRPSVIRMWKSNGLKVQEVGTGREF
ncbi:MAG TPA: hypothetical protein VNH22_01890 [Blastocatellia bacterium]|jgi:phosphoglycolate phosphatase-like HAD superfamily hydrolase|nr:hypothetical protein [Blastocatellia bacterium]